MNLKDLADSYEQQFLNTQYKIITQNNTYYVQGQPKNFLHLTGVESSHQFRNDINAKQFYYDCKNGLHMIKPTQLNYPNPRNINVIDIKTRNFFRMKNGILSSKTLYHISNNKQDGLAISEPFQIGNKTKFCTILFINNGDNGNILSPMSLQILGITLKQQAAV